MKMTNNQGELVGEINTTITQDGKDGEHNVLWNTSCKPEHRRT